MNRPSSTPTPIVAAPAMLAGRRRPLPPPLDLLEPISRREAADLLGFASDFKVRQLEREGRLQATRGALGQAWYSRRQVLALAGLMAPAASRAAGAIRPAATGAPAGAGAAVSTVSTGARWSDAALLAHLRDGYAGGDAAPPSIVDLVVDSGVSIARAEKVFRFWLAHDRHPTAAAARRARGLAPLDTSAAHASGGVAPPASEAERRAASRLERDQLIRQLRDPDPGRRNHAFRKLRQLSQPVDPRPRSPDTKAS